LLLLAARRGNDRTMTIGAGVMLALSFLMTFYLTPQLVEVGRGLDWVPRDIPSREAMPAGDPLQKSSRRQRRQSRPFRPAKHPAETPSARASFAAKLARSLLVAVRIHPPCYASCTEGGNQWPHTK